MTLNEIISNVRALLDSPSPQKPSLKKILLAVVRQSQSVHNRLSNTGRAWDIGEAPLSVMPNQEDYTLGAVSGVGKVLSIVTRDDSNPSHFERPISFCEVSSIDLDWYKPNNAGSWVTSPDGSNHTAERISVIRQGNTLKLRVKPIPQLNADYRVLYSVGDWAQVANLDDSPLLAEHHIYIETRAAIALLPYARWSNDKDEDREKRKEIGAVLGLDQEKQDEDLSAYIRTLHKSQVVEMRSYGEI